MNAFFFMFYYVLTFCDNSPYAEAPIFPAPLAHSHVCWSTQHIGITGSQGQGIKLEAEMRVPLTIFQEFIVEEIHRTRFFESAHGGQVFSPMKKAKTSICAMFITCLQNDLR